MTKEEYEAERRAISKRKSTRVYANEHNIAPQTFRWLLKEQNHFEGTPDSGYVTTPKYSQYEHPTQSDFGVSYDPEFFADLDLSKAAREHAAVNYKKYKSDLKATAENNYYNPPIDSSLENEANNNVSALEVGGIVVGVAALGYGIYKAFPYVKKGFNKLSAKVKRTFKKESKKTDDDSNDNGR